VDRKCPWIIAASGRAWPTDRPLRRSFHGRRPTVAFLVTAGSVVVWIPFDGCGYRFVRAREGHAGRLSVRTTGALLPGCWMSSVRSMLRVAGVTAIVGAGCCT